MPVDTRVSARRFDFSRETFDPTRHRRSVVSLQGRVTVEADANEQRRIDLHRNDTTTSDVVGPAGVPSNSTGFKISSTGASLTIGAGRMYVDGILCENEANCPLLGQPDLPVANLNAVPGFSGNGTYAVELRVWERDITPVDDSALLEKALGGPDTSGRTETVWQVVFEKQADPNATCDTAVMAASAAHDGKLSAQTVASAAKRDCTLPPLAGYQGLENQLYRVEIHKGGAAGTATFKWSRENGSVVTGIVANPQIGALGQTFNVQSVGADQTLGFADNQWVELSDDNTDLMADTGILAQIQHVDPAKQQITLTAPPGGNIDLAMHPKIRRWDQTGSGLGNGVLTSAVWVTLENGIQVRFDSGTYQPGDYWIIPARTAIDETTGILDWPPTPQPAQYAARHYAKLAVVSFAGGNFGTPQDCRPKFDDLVTLTKRKLGCCTVSVGDGKTSFGDYTSINEAVAAVKAMPNGGEICVLAGSYQENVTIANAKGIRIHGCHGRSKLTGKTADDPVISITDSHGIAISALAIESDTAVGVSIGSLTEAIKANEATSWITLQELDIVVRDRSAIDCHHAEDIRIAHNHLHVRKLAASLNSNSDTGFWPAIFVQADRAELLKNVVESENSTPLTTAMGGIQIGGGSTQVTVRLNKIRRGNGNGITLGSVVYVEDAGYKKSKGDYWFVFKSGQARPAYSSWIIIDQAGCVHTGGAGGGGPGNGPDGKPLVPVSEGKIEDIRIIDNDIDDMGGSGIADIVPPDGIQGVELVLVLEIRHNRITRCAALGRDENAKSDTALPGRGGIALIWSEFVTIQDNMIATNGHIFTRSICGIWTFVSSGIVIERNEILENAPFGDTNQNLEPGPRGGIVIEFALHLISKFFPDGVETGYPAARIHDNIVATNSGPALAILGMGDIAVTDNELTSHGRDMPATSPYPLDRARVFMGGYAAFIWNLAAGVELPDLIVDLFSVLTHSLPNEAKTKRLLANFTGNTTFDDNVVLMDGSNTGLSFLMSAVAVISLGHISFQANQCNAELEDSGMIFNAMAAGWSLRLGDNRFQETLLRAAFSAITIAVMNSTTGNQGTHCFAIVGMTQLLMPTPNRSLVEILPTVNCKGWIVAIGEATRKMKWDTYDPSDAQPNNNAA